MKYIRNFNEQEKSIEDWCQILWLKNYEIIMDGIIDVNGDVKININRDLRILREMPINFGVVSGYFECLNNNLISLKGCPNKVYGQFFSYEHNLLSSLEGCPEKVSGSIRFFGNKLTTLEGAPKEVFGSFECGSNKLTSLEGSPIKVGRNFSCGWNILESLEGGPKKVGGDYTCQCNILLNFEGCPEKIGGEFICLGNPIYSIFKLFKTFDRYIASLDYSYLDGTNIKERRFEMACKDAGIKKPNFIAGYTYI
jgi:hypothetical protein